VRAEEEGAKGRDLRARSREKEERDGWREREYRK
jgi:hypothetical protein